MDDCNKCEYKKECNELPGDTLCEDVKWLAENTDCSQEAYETYMFGHGS